MQQQTRQIQVRGRCKCGRRYCVHHAQAGVTVACPNCRRLIPITEADICAAEAETRLLPVQADTAEPREAIPVDHGRLKLAPEGSRPGLTDKTALYHEEAMLANAQRGARLINRTFDEIYPPPPAVGAIIELEPVQREFVHDLFASFYCAGIPRNALSILATALACWLVVSLQVLTPRYPAIYILLIPLYAIISVYIVQFYWSVLRMTAAGDDEIPWIQSDWGVWEDGLKPLIWMIAISAFCSAPAWIYAEWAARAGFVDPVIQMLLLGIGWFFWPVAVMSVSLGNSILFVRPDWLVRCVIGIGPVYLVAWLAVIISVGGWYATWRIGHILIWIPVVGMAINLYVGYVVFRTLGLLFRHFRARFPWEF